VKLPINKTQEPTLEEKYGPVALRYLGDEKGTETVGGVAGLDVAIERLCNELSENDGPLEQLRLLQEAEDEWAALRGLLPEKEPKTPAWEDKPLIARMEGIRIQKTTDRTWVTRPNLGRMTAISAAIECRMDSRRQDDCAVP
jgi:hypothetical protein